MHKIVPQGLSNMETDHHTSEKRGLEEVYAHEKSTVHEEHQSTLRLRREDEEFLVNFPDERRKKVLRKVDWRLVPLLLLLYLITYIDKTNIGNAKIEGLLPSLDMDGVQYNVALSIFFIPYVLAEVPSNMILNRFKRPSIYLGSLVLAWGIVMTLTGVVQNFGGLVSIRFFLGLFEAGFFPGAILLISKWYLPEETQTRIALLYSFAASGGAFSGLLAFAIAKMDGIGGYEGWRWIFIVEGLITILMAVVCYLFLIDSPALSSQFLEPDEIRYLELRQVARRISSASDSVKKGVNWHSLVAVLMDWKIYLLILANWSNAVPNYAMKFTMPQIVKNMGFTSAKAQLLTIPPYTVGALSAYAFSVFADRCTWRMPFIVGPQLTLVIAFSILFAKAEDIKNNVALCYFAVCLACAGMYPILPGVYAWNIANLAGPTKRAIGIAWLVCIGNIGGLIGSYIYIEEEAPKYPTGFGTSFAFASAGIIACFVLEFALWKINQRNARLTEGDVRTKYSDEDLKRMGDRSPLYKYSL